MRNFFSTLAALLLVTATSALHAEDFDLGKPGRLSMALPAGWKATSQEIPGVGVNITVRPEAPLNMACKLTVLFLPSDQEITAEQMIERWKGSLGPLAQGSVEKEPKVEQLKLKTGVGAYTCFTDASLVGKPSEPGNYKVMAPGMIFLTKGLGIATTLFADDKSGEEFAGVVKMLESITLKPAAEKTI